MEASVFHRPQKLTVYRERSASVMQLMEAVAKASMEFTPVAKDAVGVVQRRDANGRMKDEEFKYASLESLHRSTKPALLRHGVVPMQEYCVSNEGVTLVTSLNLGDQFVSSALPIRSYENQDQLVAHMSRMRRAGYAAILCLAAEVDAIAAEPEPQQEPAVTEPSANGKATAVQPKGDLWSKQARMALDAIDEAKAPAAVEDILAKVRKKIEAGDMDPHCLRRMEEAGDERIKELRKPSKPSTNGKPAPVEVAK